MTDPIAIENDISRQRRELSSLVGELSRRAHELTDVKLQVRRHALGVGLTMGAALVVIAASLGYRALVARRRRTPLADGRRVGRAVQRLVGSAESIAAEPTMTERILASAGSAAASVLIRLVMEHLASRATSGASSAAPSSPSAGPRTIRSRWPASDS